MSSVGYFYAVTCHTSVLALNIPAAIFPMPRGCFNPTTRRRDFEAMIGISTGQRRPCRIDNVRVDSGLEPDKEGEDAADVLRIGGGKG